MSIDKNEVKAWDIYETTYGDHILIFHERPFKMLRMTRIVLQDIVVLDFWRQAGLSVPEAVVIEKWQQVAFEELVKKVGSVATEDASAVAMAYAKRVFCPKQELRKR